MNKLKKIESKFGHVDIFTNEEKNLIYAIPNGYVGPQLVKKDLDFLSQFDDNSLIDWTYIVDTSKAKIVHPMNPFLLRGLSKLSKMKEYIVYAPSPMVRLMIRSASWINKPDRIISKKELLEIELNK